MGNLWEHSLFCQFISPILGPGHLAEVGQDPTFAKIPLHTLSASETSQVCPDPQVYLNVCPWAACG